MIRYAMLGQFTAVSWSVVLGGMVLFFGLAWWGYDPQRGVMKQRGAAA
ncbi:MAG: hypothetical protein Fur007_17650 [Rhodoferax sp.]